MMTTPPPVPPSHRFFVLSLVALGSLAPAWSVGCGGASRGDKGTTPGGSAPFDPEAQTVVHLAGGALGGRALPTGRFLSAGVLGRVDDAGEAVLWATDPPALAEPVEGAAFHPDGGVTVLADGVVFHTPGPGTGFTALGRVPGGFGWVDGAPRAHAGPFLLARAADGRRFALDPGTAALTPLPAAERGFVQLALVDRGHGVGLGVDARLWRWSIGDGAPAPLPDDLPVAMPLAAGNGELWLMPARGRASPVRLDPSTGETHPVAPPPVLAARGPRAPGLPSVGTTPAGELLALDEDGVLRRHDPRTLDVRGEARPDALAPRCFLVPRGAAVLARCVASGGPDGRVRARFFRVAPSGDEVAPIPIPGMAQGTTIDALVAEDGSAIYWEGTCETPAGWDDAAGGGDDVVYDEHGEPVDEGGDDGDPWCVVALDSAAATQVRLPRRLGRPAGFTAGRFVGRARARSRGHGDLEPMDPDAAPDDGSSGERVWGFDVTSGAVVEAPAPWSPDASPVEVEVQPDGTVLALATTFSPPADGAQDPTMVVRAHRGDLDALFEDPEAPWTALPLSGDLRGVGFGPDGRHGLAVAIDGLRRTEDGGATWTSLPLPVTGDASRLFTRTTRVRCGAQACGRAETGAGLPSLVAGRGPAAVPGRGVLVAPAPGELAALTVDADDVAPSAGAGPAGYRCAIDPNAPGRADALVDSDSGVALPAPVYPLPRRRRIESIREIYNALDLTAAVVADGRTDDEGMARTRVLWGGRDARGRRFRRASAPFPAPSDQGAIRVVGASPAGVVVLRAGRRGARGAAGEVLWVAPGEAPVPLRGPGGDELDGGGAFGLPGVLPGGRLVIGRKVPTETGFTYDELLVVGPEGGSVASTTPVWNARRSAVALVASGDGPAAVVRWRETQALALPLGAAERRWPERRPDLDGRARALAACAGDPGDAPRLTARLAGIGSLGLVAPFSEGVAELSLPAGAPPCIRRVLVTSWRGAADGDPPAAILVPGTDGALVADGVRCAPPE